MKLKSLLFGILLGTGLLVSIHLQAAAYIKFDGVDGESTQKDHKGWCDLQSVEWGIARPLIDDGTGSTRRRGSATVEDLVCAKELDKASPKLMEAIATGRVYPLVTVHLTRATAAGQDTYLEYELRNVIVSSWSTSGSTGGDERPTEEIRLDFEEIKMIYTEYDASGLVKGKVEATWKVEEGTI